MINNKMKTLSEKYPTKMAITSEIINLKAILNLPKPTEAFMSDLHGEYDAFQHLIRTGAGNLRQKIAEVFSGEMTEDTMQAFAFLVYYPTERLALKHAQLSASELDQWYLTTFKRLIDLLKFVSTKYTRSKVRKAMAPDFVYITEELMYGDVANSDKKRYFQEITTSIISMGQADALIIATSHTIQRLVVDHWHIIGDIYDRGPRPDLIVEQLTKLPAVDIQWGNHDILWFGAASGSQLCMLNLLRICARYNNLAIIEKAYGIDLSELVQFAQRTYQPNPAFEPKVAANQPAISTAEKKSINQVHQAIAIMQFKLEQTVIKRNPDFKMDHRLTLSHVDFEQQTIHLNGHDYPLDNTCFQTVDPTHPEILTSGEAAIVTSLLNAFTHCQKLRKHLRFLIDNGSMYQLYNQNLLFHGCIPVDEAGNFLTLTLANRQYAGKSLLDFFDHQIRMSFDHPLNQDNLSTDLLWYLWTGPLSPLFGKNAMTTFERYFSADPVLHEEKKNAYYQLRHQEDFIEKLLLEFGLTPETGHILNGHTPVKKGHNPIMANRKMIVIDGGFSKAYHHTTGIGGFTLLYNSYGMQLVTHQPFTTRANAIAKMQDIISTRRVIDQVSQRQRVSQTNIGAAIKTEIEQLTTLLGQKNKVSDQLV
ncbi:fructose-1,6-bisphosphatase [Latilactobacillus curvatus]|uniref:fructose-1,6-bisphosphatase n=1 Tax=Latilactobacillus curvatus TaxID=28038 RepID=UPI0020C7F243|nr:fructose-1,6-bisphosphatase [Latilactobacillus curvatus]MCP8847255.1 fructose-1,6-bisphosphatase [Latilactobacillus curvatus]MCP8864711.1 fructose-1,6-bisphosphatase [Latilactobacillus curvatus]MCP8873521.1 fructose-1,6-bisphosphatase [Latilactobacillus curvatus]MCP8875381.1 fructose-1,6-bisphosphatase [Latilactobacillus curvatus]MCP8878906.1 fructose-1,6-bisphosphatase [Latilactobacillus curvatus]